MQSEYGRYGALSAGVECDGHCSWPDDPRDDHTVDACYGCIANSANHFDTQKKWNYGSDLPIPHTFDSMPTYRQTPPVIVEQGEKLEVSCTRTNPRDEVVSYDILTQGAKCHQVILAYPAGALDNTEANEKAITNLCLR